MGSADVHPLEDSALEHKTLADRWEDGKMESRIEFEEVLHMLAMNDEVEDFETVQEIETCQWLVPASSLLHTNLK